MVLYAWGTGDPKKLKEVSRRMGYDHVVVHIGSLYKATVAAGDRFFTAVDENPELTAQVEHAARQWLTDITTSRLDDILARTGGWPAV